MRTLGHELRHALRAIVRRPAINATIVMTLALGLGANAAVFGVIDALALRPFPIPDVDRLVMLSHSRDDEIDRQESVSPADFLDVRAQADTLEHLAAMDWWDANLVGGDEPERVQGFRVSPAFFTIMGVQPVAGRFFLKDEETHGRHQVVVLGDGLWRRRFAADPSVIGRTIQVDGASYEVVGIAPAKFDFPMGSQIWAPMSFDAAAAAVRQQRYLTVIGRLAPGRTLDEAKSQAAVIADRLAVQHPATNKGYVGRLYTLSYGMMDIGLGPILSMWQASALFVLLIACANVASLLLARGAERQREMAVRLAIGASRWRVMREMLLEGLLLALMAVPAAVFVASVSLNLIRSAMPARIARFVVGWQTIDMDGRVVAVTVGLAALATLISALVPALQASRPRFAESLKEGGRGTSAGTRMRLRRGLVIGEMALALPLLVSCGLSALAVNRFTNGPMGFDPDRVLSMSVVLADVSYGTPIQRRQFAEQAVERLRALPGVQSVAAINVPPAIGGNSGRSIEIDGRPNPDPANPPSVDYRAATPAIFETLGIPILRGRGFNAGDSGQGQPVAIVSESLAGKYWPGQDPIGRRIKVASEWLTVVGISGDIIHNWFMRRNYPTLYRPLAQAPAGGMALLLRTPNDPTSLAADARTALRMIDPAQPVFDVMTLREMVRERAIGLQYIAGIMLALGGLALLLAVIGVYGVMAYLVTQRTHEIGVRMALGATGRDVLRLTVGQTGRLTAIGVGLGVALSLALGRLIQAGLLGVAPADVRVLVFFAVVLVTAALAAGLVPARRAAAVDPMVALRES